MNSVVHLPEDEPTMMSELPLPAETPQPIEQVTDSLANTSVDRGGKTNTFTETEALGKPDTFVDTEASRRIDTLLANRQETEPVGLVHHDSMPAADGTREPDTVSLSRELKKAKLKIRSDSLLHIVGQRSRIEHLAGLRIPIGLES